MGVTAALPFGNLAQAGAAVFADVFTGKSIYDAGIYAGAVHVCAEERPSDTGRPPGLATLHAPVLGSEVASWPRPPGVLVSAPCPNPIASVPELWPRWNFRPALRVPCSWVLWPVVGLVSRRGTDGRRPGLDGRCQRRTATGEALVGRRGLPARLGCRPVPVSLPR